MFNNINWQSYWTSIALITTVYYLAVFLIYFRKDFRQFLSLKVLATYKGLADSPSPITHTSGTLPEEKDKTEEHIVYACIDEIKALFDGLKRSKGVKQEIIYGLSQVLSKYPTLKDSGYRRTINHVIVLQCEHHCSIRLSTEEADHVWIG